MSRFGEALVASARENSAGGRGLTTGEPDDPRRRSWGEVHETALRIAGTLRSELRPGDAVAVLAGEPALIAPAVQAVWLVGGSVTMLQQPTPRTDLAHWSGETLRALGVIEAELVLLGAPFEELAEVLDDSRFPCRSLSELVDTATEPLGEEIARPADGTALLQLTSGATAEPKAVRITDANLHANVRAMLSAIDVDLDHDVLVAWLPLFHDMGMVGCLTLPMMIGLETVLITPADFLARPLLWPELISRYRATLTVAPNFGYALLARRMSRATEGAFDLSSLRLALNGAEPVDPAAVRSFTESGAAFGLSPDCVACAFGMAESTLAVSLAPPGRGLEVDVVDGGALEADGAAVPVEDGRRFALLGRPLDGLEVVVVDDAGRELGERMLGQLRIRGESVTSGYLTADGPVAARDELGWLSTGDDGYLVDGQVVICGRRKDVIIMGGRNIYPTDVEYAACEVDDVRAGNAAAVRREAAGAGRERFAVVVESRLAGTGDAEKAVRKQVAARVFETVGFRPSAVVVLEPGSLPKTPSGKLKRAEAAQLIRAPEEPV